MKEQVYKYGFPRFSRLIAVISLIAVLGFMSTFFQAAAYSEEDAINEEAYKESLGEFESLYLITVR